MSENTENDEVNEPIEWERPSTNTNPRKVFSYRKYPIVIIERTKESEAATICDEDIEECRHHAEYPFEGKTDQEYMDYVGELLKSVIDYDIDYSDLPDPVANLYLNLVDSPTWEKVEEENEDDIYLSIYCTDKDGKQTGDNALVDRTFWG